ncbi:MAG: RNA polymerase sigma factor [Elusimicrobiota bacterium]
MDNDLTLINRFLKGDKESFNSLVKLHKNRVFNTVFSITGAGDIADDVTQDVFIKVYRELSKFKGNSAFTSWLYRIAVNASLDEMRKRKRRIYDSLDEEGAINLPKALIEKGNPAEGMEREEVSIILQKALNRLPEKYRTVLVLKEIDGLSYDDIGNIMKISVNKVKVWIFRAREKFRKQMGGML